MNRRDFIRGFAGALAGFTILPAATTYERLWKAERLVRPVWIINPAWLNATYETVFLTDGEGVPDPFPTRFNDLPPPTFYGFERGHFKAWIQEHSIPPVVRRELVYA